MRKLTILAIFLLGMISSASADLGVRIGVGAEVGNYTLSGTETTPTKTNTSESNDGDVYVPLGSIFIEKQLSFMPSFLERLSVGYSFVPHDLKSASIGNGRTDRLDSSKDNLVDQSIQVEISNINTMYATFDIFSWLYVKAGTMDLDVKTLENLGTGSSYGDFTSSGDILGLGAHKTLDNGIFLRFEAEDSSYSGKTLVSTTNANNTVVVNDFDGTTYRVSIGKSF